MSGIDAAYTRFKAAETLLRCPICGSALGFANKNSLICDNKHCFDLSRRGYINFAPAQGFMKYTKELFENRREILRGGFYAPLIERLTAIIDNYSDNTARILDAGCGEGFFSAALSDSRDMFAMDILKDAIIMASSNKTVKWLVGDLANIPLRGASMDIVLNILAPANYSEFSRVLRGGGVLIKVVPGNHYLAELRELSGMGSYSNADVLRRFSECVHLSDKQSLTYELPVNAAQAEAFVKMTPLLFGSCSSINPNDVGRITIDLDILVGAYCPDT